MTKRHIGYGAAVNAIIEEGDRADLVILIKRLLLQQEEMEVAHRSLCAGAVRDVTRIFAVIKDWQEVLGVYADPFEREEEDGTPFTVPNYYDELDFGALARDALAAGLAEFQSGLEDA